MPQAESRHKRTGLECDRQLQGITEMLSFIKVFVLCSRCVFLSSSVRWMLQISYINQRLMCDITVCSGIQTFNNAKFNHFHSTRSFSC